MKLELICAILAVSSAATSAVIAAGSEEVQGVQARPAALRVIDEKCLECHNRKRIEEAAKQRKDIENIMQRMEKRGAVVTAKEREVIGHFWQQSPFRSNK